MHKGWLQMIGLAHGRRGDGVEVRHGFSPNRSWSTLSPPGV
jgi:hypothetical protein